MLTTLPKVENSVMSVCHTCELLDRRISGNAPIWDDIYHTDHWYVVHSYNSALLGWLVLIPKRHVVAIDDLTDIEAAEFGLLLRRTSAALNATTGCVKTYVMQFAEQAEHPHVHFHVVLRMSDQPEERRSTKMFGYLNVAPEEKVSEKSMVELALQIRTMLDDFDQE